MMLWLMIAIASAFALGFSLGTFAYAAAKQYAFSLGAYAATQTLSEYINSNEPLRQAFKEHAAELELNIKTEKN
jgi:hypothetical protein